MSGLGETTMGPAAAHRAPPLPGLIQLGLIGTLLALAALAWAVTGEQMSGMDAGPGTDPGTLGFFLGVWVVMMAAMMFPSIMPMVVMYARIQEGRRGQGEAAAAGATAIFVAGYLVAWTAAGLLGYAGLELGRAATGDLFSWDAAGPYLAGGVLVGAAAYQLTRPKDLCLRYCRDPFMFVTAHWRPGPAGALGMGAIHGCWCVGCCWALMASLFALGMMSLGWMALIAALIAVERLLPWREVANRGIALLLVAIGILLAFAPGALPGLTVPGSPAAMSGMEGTSGMQDGAMGGQSSIGTDSMDSGSSAMP